MSSEPQFKQTPIIAAPQMERGSLALPRLGSLCSLLVVLFLVGCSGSPGTPGQTPCTDDSNCPADEYCDMESGLCTPGCTSDEACDQGEFCDPATMACAPGCADDSACAGVSGQPHCDPMTRACVECGDDTQCPDGEFCDANVCRSGCDAEHPCDDAATTCCDGLCADLQMSPGNCGGCGIACDDDQVCSQGACGLPCPEGQLRCGDECIIPANDPANCGSCGNMCPAEQVCGLGACAEACPDGQENCMGSCASLSSDSNNCGLCGNACEDGYRCMDGSCQLDCPPEQIGCGTECVNLMTDRTHCGSCDYACLSGQVCVDGMCEVMCPSIPIPQTACDGVCVDLATDPQHCGSCGNVCRQGCSMGVCSSIAEVALDYRNTCIRYTSGRVFCVGYNHPRGVTTGSGGGRTHVRSPVECDDSIGRPVENMDQIDLGYGSACGPRADGRVLCWGFDFTGRASQVPEIDRARQVSGNVGAWAVRRSDGSVWEFNRLGPTAVTGVTNASHISRGYDHTCALLRTGSIQCWGENDYGQLGDSSITDATAELPTTVSGISNAVDLWAGRHYACAREADGRVYCWGRNDYGQLGDGTTTARATPVEISELRGSVHIGLEVSHGCAVLADGTVKCWGLNHRSQLGDGTTTNRTTPVSVPGLLNQRFIAVGSDHSCSINMDDELYCWGGNAYGQTGGDTEGAASPTLISTLPAGDNVAQISRTLYSYCARLASGAVNCWSSRQSGRLGGNNRGELGRGSAVGDKALPAPVLGISTASELAGGNYHSCVLLSSGRVRCWGGGTLGQLGNGLDDDLSEPTEVTGITDAVELALGANHACVRRSSGTISCWGYNGYGQLGDGTETNRNLPVNVSSLGGSVASLSLGVNHSCAVLTDGRVQCWGSNINLQIGDGTRTNKPRPTFVLQACPGEARADCTDQLTGIGFLACSGNICYAGVDSNDLVGSYWGGATTPSGWAGFAADNPLYRGRRTTSFGQAITGYIRETAPGTLESRFSGRSEWGNGLGGFTYSYPVPPGASSSRGATISTEFTHIIAAYNEQMPSCGLKTDGVYCWGRTAEGRLAAAGLADITPEPTQMSAPGPLE